MTLLVTSATLLLALVGVPPGAVPSGAAQPPPPPSPAPSSPTSPTPPAAAATPAVKAEARQRFDRGLGLFDKGDYPAALAEFKRAYELIPTPVVLYNVGLVYAAMNRPVEATDALDRFLTEVGEKGAPETRRNAVKVRDEQAARVAGLMVIVDQPAVIQLDGVEIARAPLSAPLRVSSGAHTITVMAAGYLPARREITLAGQVTETVTLTLLPTEAATAHMAIAVSVPGAEVWINGSKVGTTPLPATVAVAPGDATIEVRRAGYRTASRQLHIDNGASAHLELALEEDPTALATSKGRLRLLLSDPASSEVTVDGLTAVPYTDGLLLPSGPHVVRVRREGFEPYQSTVAVTAGRDTSVAVAMTPTPETRARAEQSVRGRGVLGWSLVGAGAALVAGAAVYALATRGDVGDAQTALDQRLKLESMNIAQNFCYLGPNPMYPGYYEAMRCGDVKASLQDDLDHAKLRRVLAYSGMGVGAVVAGVGTYLLLTRDGARAAALGQVAGTPALNVAFDGTRLFGTLTARF